ncbi:MAG TPA: amino acid adenylation domain-containing protein [Ktedonobacteraceae bacterium]|nr:amino acid adenylation domain-containing protein [Ktedonobacteraceae bacterium]
MSLRDLVMHSAKSTPEALAVKGPDTSITYAELDSLANRFARALLKLGVRRGDRVGIWLEKSAYTIVAMQGALRLGAIYVPLDPLSPAARIHTILCDCDVRVLVTMQSRAEAVLSHGSGLQHMVCLCLDGTGPGLNWNDIVALSDEQVDVPAPGDNEIAYILYTSGSTGKPKGVCITHRNALAFIEWAAEMLQASPADRFANHAPFHFDLSVLDLYVAFHTGAAVFLIPDGISFLPRRLVNFIVQEELTIWYSVPSVLVLMMEQGGLLDVQSLPLRTILFAGEPFPVKHLRRLHDRWPEARFLNLYGPTETNVCTFYEVKTIQPDHTKPVPIGSACSGDRVWAQKDDGSIVNPGEEGELMVSGPTVMMGYWGQPAHGDRPYATGDLVRLQEDGDYVYLGRRDHMAKIRGHRVELGDIEAVLEEHPEIHEAAVIVIGSGLEARLIAFVVNAGGRTPSLLELKRHCAERLPRSMIVDAARFLSALPRTRNGKIDRQALLSGEINEMKKGEH